jgi:hypothetical protein
MQPPSVFARVLLAVSTLASSAGAAVYESRNFRVVAPTRELAQFVAEQAERQRIDVAERWLGRQLPDWPRRCTIELHEEDARCGLTSYEIVRGEVTTLAISLRGDVERSLGVFLPHEIAHAVVVSGLGRRPPRWADEGIAMLAEPAAIRNRQRRFAAELSEGTGLRIRELLDVGDYPVNRPELLGFYARSHAVTAFLVERRDPAAFLDFVDRGVAGDWDAAVRTAYGYDDLESLETACAEWLQRRTVPGTTANALADAAE